MYISTKQNKCTKEMYTINVQNNSTKERSKRKIPKNCRLNMYNINVRIICPNSMYIRKNYSLNVSGMPRQPRCQVSFDCKSPARVQHILLLQVASVLPMHGIDPGDDTYTTTKEDGRMSQKVKNAA